MDHRSFPVTTTSDVLLIQKYGIQSRGYSRFGKKNPPRSLDFGEEFYCSFDSEICRKQVNLRAKTKAEEFRENSLIMEINIANQINYNKSLKYIYFDGRIDIDGLKWAKYIAFHRVKKSKEYCTKPPCDGHPDIIIGPGKAITYYAQQAYDGLISYEDFYEVMTNAKWFPHYKQIVCHDKALEYLTPVLKLT